jgi:hypothetical protein
MLNGFKEFFVFQEIASGSYFPEPTPAPGAVAAFYNGPVPGNHTLCSPETPQGNRRKFYNAIKNFLPVTKIKPSNITKRHGKV